MFMNGWSLSGLTSTRRARIVAALGFALLWALPAPSLVMDSEGYIRASPTRPPLLPCLINAAGALVGASAALRVTVFVQALLAILSCWALLTELGRGLRFPLARCVILAALIMPQLKATRTIASESLAYSCVCVFVAMLVSTLAGRVSNRRVLMLVLAACGAYLTRAQFIYLVPLAALTSCVVIGLPNPERSRPILAAGTLGILGAAFAFSATYMQLRSGSVGGVSVAGVQLLTSVIHVSNRDDLDRAALGSDRVFAERFYAHLEHDGMLASQRDAAEESVASDFFADRYNKILNVMAEEFRAIRLVGDLEVITDPLLWGMSANQLRELDRTTKNVAKGLLSSTWPRFLKQSARSIWEWHRYFCITVMFGLALALSELWRNPRSPAARVLTLAAVAWVTNVCVVALVEPPLNRYTFYFDAIFLAVFCRVAAAGFGFRRGNTALSGEYS